MEIEIISKECIKPSSPTPLHLKTHKLSFLDQYMPPSYIPLVLYYSVINQDQYSNPFETDTVSKRLQILKQSLSEVLVLLYPFAGTVKDKLSIDCNDKGVYFVEAHMKNGVFLHEFLIKPNVSLISKYLPAESKWSPEPIPGAHITSIQATSFDCGGIVIGVSFYHMMVDGTSMSTFLKSWAATARKSTSKEAATVVSYNINPNFDSSYMFPQNAAFPKETNATTMTTPFVKNKKWVTNRFVFDASAIAELKSKATSSRVENPTRVETISAMIFKCISSFHKSTLLTHAVNLRRRSVPPFPEQSIGNLVWMTTIPINRDGTGKEKEADLQALVYQLRKTLRKIDGDFVRRLQGDEGLTNFVEAVKDESKSFSGVDDYLGFTSWCKFGYYEVDFGWGKPTWVSSIGLNELQYTPFFNTIILMDTSSGDGIEAWVFLGEEDMAVLLLNEELRSYALLNPSPLG